MIPLILFLLAVALLLRIEFIFYVVYVCLGVYAWSRWYTPRAFRQLHVVRKFASHAFWGEKIDIALRVTNNNRLPLPWLQVNESLAVQLRLDSQINDVISLAGHDTIELTYHIQAKRRGYYRLGPTRLTTSDLFGFVPEQQGYLPADYLTVYPRLIPLTQLGVPARLPFGTIASRQRLFADPARPVGVREFRSGDSLRQINWKASAHTQELLVRTYQPAISLETAVLLNLHAADYSRRDRAFFTEWAIEVAASLAAHLIDQRQAVGLLSNGLDPLRQSDLNFDEASGRLVQQSASAAAGNPRLSISAPMLPRHGRTHLMKLLERLARLEMTDTLPFTEFLATACLPLNWGVTVIAITGRGDAATCASLHRLVRAGLNPVLLAVEPDHNFGLVRQRARQLGFTAYHVSGEKELDRWQRPLPETPL